MDLGGKEFLDKWQSMMGRSRQSGLSDLCIDQKWELSSAIWNTSSPWRSLKNQRQGFQIQLAKHGACCLLLQQRHNIFWFSLTPSLEKKGIYKFPQFGKGMLWCVLDHFNTDRFRLPTMVLSMFCAAAEWASLDMRITEMHAGRQNLYATPEVGLYDLP